MKNLIEICPLVYEIFSHPYRQTNTHWDKGKHIIAFSSRTLVLPVAQRQTFCPFAFRCIINQLYQAGSNYGHLYVQVEARTETETVIGGLNWARNLQSQGYVVDNGFVLQVRHCGSAAARHKIPAKFLSRSGLWNVLFSLKKHKETCSTEDRRLSGWPKKTEQQMKDTSCVYVILKSKISPCVSSDPGMSEVWSEVIFIEKIVSRTQTSVVKTKTKKPGCRKCHKLLCTDESMCETLVCGKKCVVHNNRSAGSSEARWKILTSRY